MKTSILRTALALLFSLSLGTAFAQRDSLPAERMAYRLKSQLSLNEDQTIKIRDIYREEGRKRNELRTTVLDPGEKRAAIHKIREETDMQIKALLNPEQQKAYDLAKEKMRQERKEHMKEKRQEKNRSN